MNKVSHEGNLPVHLRMFAGVMAQSYEAAEFFECNTIEELKSVAREGKGELHVTMDPTTSRGFAVAFDVKESPIYTVGGDSFHQLVIYFKELERNEYREFKQMMHEARNAQEDDMIERSNRAQRRRAQKSKLKELKKLNIDGIDYSK